MSKVILHCPSCGSKFSHNIENKGKLVAGSSGLAAGAILGAKVGIAMGPLGAIAGTVPGAILGGIFGKNIGKSYDNPQCPFCGTKFQIPNSIIYNHLLMEESQNIPEDIHLLINNKLYFELAEQLVILEINNNMGLVNTILNYLKKTDKTLMNNVQVIRKDLRERNNLI